MDAKIRKHQHTLVIAGYANILFGIWDVAKSLLNLTLNESLYEMIENNAVDFPRELMLVSTVLAGLIVFIVLLIYFIYILSKLYCFLPFADFGF